MTIVTFRKTRIVYYENDINKLTITNAATNVTSSTPNDNDTTLGYVVCRVKGADHNWFKVPINQWGLYVKENEWVSLQYNNKMIIPKHMKVSLGHSIPTAKYPSGSGTTTSLSFNNTIFSLIYENHDTINVIGDQSFADLDSLTTFTRTYDGGRADNLQRNLLPKPDILYKVPDYRNSATDDSAYTQLVTTLPGTPTVPLTAVVDEAFELTKNELKLAYLPEFLLDDSNVSVLYPGENQYIYNYDIPDNDANKVDMSAGQFNEAFSSMDHRSQYRFNSNLANNTVNNNMSLLNKIVPRVRNTNLTRATNADSISRRRDDIYFNQSMGFIQDGPHEVWIKGCPILDPSNNLVSHSFLCTVTWELTVECVANDIWIPRPLIEGWCSYGVGVYHDLTNTRKYKARFTKPYPRKLQPQGFMRTPHAHPKFTDQTFDKEFPQDGIIPISLIESDIQDFQRFDTVNDTIPIIPNDNFIKTTPPTLQVSETSEGLKKTTLDNDFEMV